MDRTILPRHRNDVLQAMTSAGLRPEEFEWKRVGAHWHSESLVDQLTHRSGVYYFQFDTLEDKPWTICCPGVETSTQKSYPGSWDYQLREVHEWATRVAGELKTPDLWAAFTPLPEDRDLEDDPDAHFTEDERTRVSGALNEMSAYARSSLHLPDDRLEVVERRIAYLHGAIERQSKLDWVHTFVGVFATLVTSAVLAPEQAAEIWRIGVQFLSGIVRLPPSR